MQVIDFSLLRKWLISLHCLLMLSFFLCSFETPVELRGKEMNENNQEDSIPKGDLDRSRRKRQTKGTHVSRVAFPCGLQCCFLVERQGYQLNCTAQFNDGWCEHGPSSAPLSVIMANGDRLISVAILYVQNVSADYIADYTSKIACMS